MAEGQPGEAHRILIGPAGWSYADWKGIVYPAHPPRGFDPAAFLARYFDVIELNAPFYRTPLAATARAWSRRTRAVNPRFRLTTKLLQTFTHQRGAGERETAAVRSYLDVLMEEGTLGALLLQFPWSFHNTQENRGYLHRLRTQFEAYPLVAEVRHDSWNRPEVLDWMRQQQIGLCAVDQPLLSHGRPPSDEVTSAVGYVRLHGRNYQAWFGPQAHPRADELPAGQIFRPEDEGQRYNYLYTDAELKGWEGRVRHMAGEAGQVYVIANNHFEGKAVVNALELSTALLGRRPPLPEELVNHYPRLRALAEPGDAAD